ncbi:unnamed protein product [Cylicocyclus nassatus]|uniref:SXP/RAL-2 family protein Ani s 5-like cation-binding domain-containing protein n=1 Tax=Cylicocyclus nassatus TaxID=53992 RepID=A0AA36M8C9_CYLNA|nr:unnamed protein product [Cylicocyclus nassatus]
MFFVLLASLACLSVTHPSPRNQTQHQLPKIPFLKEVDSTGKQEFQMIFADKDVTRPQFDEKLFNWAEKFNVTESVKKFKAKMEKDKNAAEEELQEALTRLSQFFRENKEIADDNNITWAQADYDREQLLLNLTVKQQQAAFMLRRIPERYVSVPGT